LGRDVTIVVRPAGPGDLDGIADVHAVARHAYYAAAGAASPVPADHRDAWAALIEQAGADLTVAVDGERVVAFLASGWARDESLAGQGLLELAALYVLPPLWGTGLAARLHSHYRDRLQSLQASGGVLDVWERNARALGFYAKHGWTPDGRVRSDADGTQYVELRLPAP
jgi:GNAT superfamily N-acetyltransferase